MVEHQAKLCITNPYRLRQDLTEQFLGVKLYLLSLKFRILKDNRLELSEFSRIKTLL